MQLKRLLTSAVLVIAGCGDAAPDGAEVPPFSSAGPPFPGTIMPPDPANNPGAEAPVEGAASPTAPPSDPLPTNEDPSGIDLPVAPSSDDDGASAASGETEGTAPDPNGMTGGDEPPAPEGDSGDTADGEAVEPPPEPAPPPRPPLDCSVPQPAFSGGTQSCTLNASGGADDGQSWFMWYSGNSGCMTTRDDGAFRATWNNSGDFLARIGLAFDETKTFDQYGTIGADLAFRKSGTGGGYSFIGVYGWSNDPLVEYYIVEDSYGNGLATPFATQQRGQFNVDGATYRIYTGTKTNQPSIHGTATFLQVFSVRQSPRQCGHVSITDHFRQWQSMGINLGKMYEARVLVEAGGGSGGIDFTTAYVTASVQP